jgi:hypothetical protein
MKFRQSQLLAATSIMTAGTKVIDINIKDVISRLSVIVRGVNSSWDPVGHPSLIAKQIDLVDGSDVLHSMRGGYTQAVAFYGTRKQPFNYINYTDNGTCVAVMPIYFGRHLWDKELALDPAQFNNLQLKVEHNFALGGATPDACTLEVWADIFDDKPAGVKGFLMSKSHWTKTLVASTTDYIDLPTDHAIRLVMPAAQSDDEEPDINIDNIKLSEEQDKRVVLECGTLEALQMFESEYPAWLELMEGRLPANADQEFWVTPCKDIQIDPFGSQDTDSIIHVPWSGGSGRKINGSILTLFNANVTGRSPHGVIPLPMGNIEVIEDWWETPALGSARIKMVTGLGDTSSLYELLLQQYRKYA